MVFRPRDRVQPSTFNLQQPSKTFNLQKPSTFNNLQPSKTFNLQQPSTFNNLQPSTTLENNRSNNGLGIVSKSSNKKSIIARWRK
ncbi:MAG: hypothetical protein F6J98_20475 [Moorea sp. SIO4G2]|nr:hypothetical protein [Moorena sp. SIO4G2]